MIDLKLLETLKEKMKTEKVLQNIFEYFLDHFGEKPGFSSMGKKTRHELVESFLERAAMMWYSKKPIPDGFLLIEIPEYQFIHGACMIEGGILNVLYFDDLQIGVIATTGGNPRATQMMRITIPANQKEIAARN